MPAAEANALAALRTFNYERIYVRTASLEQSRAVVEVLQALVGFFAAHPAHPAASAGLEPDSEAAVQAAVAYVAGMTDRYAFNTAVTELGWDPAALPRGIDRGR